MTYFHLGHKDVLLGFREPGWKYGGTREKEQRLESQSE